MFLRGLFKRTYTWNHIVKDISSKWCHHCTVRLQSGHNDHSALWDSGGTLGTHSTDLALLVTPAMGYLGSSFAWPTTTFYVIFRVLLISQKSRQPISRLMINHWSFELSRKKPFHGCLERFVLTYWATGVTGVLRWALLWSEYTQPLFVCFVFYVCNCANVNKKSWTTVLISYW